MSRRSGPGCLVATDLWRPRPLSPAHHATGAPLTPTGTRKSPLCSETVRSKSARRSNEQECRHKESAGTFQLRQVLVSPYTTAIRPRRVIPFKWRSPVQHVDSIFILLHRKR